MPPSNSSSRYLFMRSEVHIHKTSLQMFPAVLFLMIKPETIQTPSTADGWVWHWISMPCNTTRNEKEWSTDIVCNTMNLESVCPVKAEGKRQHIRSPYVKNTQKYSPLETENRSVVVWGWGREQGLAGNGQEGTFWDDNSVLKLHCTDCYTM